MKNDLISIIMLSHNDAAFIADSVKGVQAQTYQNWELLFLDDSSSDETIIVVSDLRGNDNRIKISKTVTERGTGNNRNTALKQAKGRWICFLNAGDIWEPTKLEKQLTYMNEHNYAVSYTKYKMIDEYGQPIGGEVGGPQIITQEEMRKCCWVELLTLMYDREIVGNVSQHYLMENNEYSLLLLVCEAADCYLLDECLAVSRIRKKTLKNYPIYRRVRWRYEVYRIDQHMNPFRSFYMTVRNFYYTMVRKHRYFS